MNGIGLGAPAIPKVSSRVEITNSCNCCCFPRRRKITKEEMEIVRTVSQVLKK